MKRRKKPPAPAMWPESATAGGSPARGEAVLLGVLTGLSVAALVAVAIWL